MERMTTKRDWNEAEHDLRAEMGYSHIWKRLNAIEDILGDTYGLDRLRELVEADRELLENGTDYAVFASKKADGDVILAAYNTNPGQKLELAAQIQADAILDAMETGRTDKEEN